nr:MAG TPA: hypothetical protein [Caudoviricetes sp.]
MPRSSSIFLALIRPALTGIHFGRRKESPQIPASVFPPVLRAEVPAVLTLPDLSRRFRFHPKPLFLSSTPIIPQKGADVHAVQGIQNFPRQSEIL